jgi:hypothetical protein
MMPEDENREAMTYALILVTLVLTWLVVIASHARAHDIYEGVHGKQCQLCCGGSDCAPTTYRETKGRFQFLTREKQWVEIPEDRIIFLPIPGDPPSDDAHHGHLCYRAAGDDDRQFRAQNVFGDIYLYCAFVDPGGV